MKEKIIITIKGSKTGDAEYTLEMEEAQILLLKMALAKDELK